MIEAAQRVPPHDTTAERHVLGLAVGKSDAFRPAGENFGRLRSIVGADDFFRPAHATLWRALCDMADAGKPIELAAVAAYLRDTGELGAVGRDGTPDDGADYLFELAETYCFATAHLDYYAGIVRDHARRRAFIVHHTNLANDAWDPTYPVEPGRGAVVRLSDVEPQPVRWLHPYRIALGKLTVIAGNPGLGKSFLTLDYAARVSRGDGFADCPASTSQPGGVVLLSAEDDLSDTIRPRLDAAGADVSRVVALTYPAFNLTDHLPILETAIGQADNCKLVIIDPISAYLGGADSHKDSEVRALLAPLADLASRYGVAVIAVSHLNKGNGDALTRFMGSLAFVAAARAAYVVTKDANDPARRLLLPVKNNIGIDDTGLAYRLEGGAMPRVEWESLPVRVSADEAVSSPDRKRGPAPKEREEAESWLLDFLAGGPQPAEVVFAEAGRVGITQATLRRAKDAAGVESKKQGKDGPWAWQLPGYTPPPEPAAPEDAHEDAQLPLCQTT